MLRRIPPLAAACALCACGLDLSGTFAQHDAPATDQPGDGAPGASPDGAPHDDATSAGLDADTDAATPIADAGSDNVTADAPPPPPPPPADAGAPILYVVSSRFWRYDPTGGSWASVNLPSATCPLLNELAVDANGTVYGTDTNALYVVEPIAVSCTRVGGSGSPYPRAMSFAPAGTIAAGEVLVGYRDNGDYVRVDTATGTTTVVSGGALAGYTMGDLVNVGATGYVSGSGSDCGNNTSCLWEIDWSNGKTQKKVGTFQHVMSGLAHWGGKLFAFSSPDGTWRADPTNPNGAASIPGPSGYTNVTYHGAGSRTIAPTK